MRASFGGVREASIGDWLYLPDMLYAVMLIMVISAGAGRHGLDALILELIGKRGA
jgi:hypothetical protein